MVLKAINVVGATIVIQVCLVLIMTVGVFFYRRLDSWQSAPYASLLWLVLLSMLAIVFGDEFYAVWSPVLGDAQLFSISRGNSFMFIFILDMLIAAWLVLNTGGSHRSPFTGILFLIPSLAIFLRETPPRFITYAFIAIFLYLLLSGSERPTALGGRLGPPNSPLPTWWVNITCLLLTMYIGYITRPELL